MSYPKYHFTTNVSIPISSSSQEQELRTIARKLFDAWSKNKGAVPDRGQQLFVNTTIEEISEGMSTADVYQLTFTGGNSEVFARFIIRIHQGLNALDEAERERGIARDIGSSTHIDAFSAQVEEAIPDYKQIVIYRHTDDQIGDQTKSLREAILGLLENPASDATTMANALSNMMQAVVAAYDSFQMPMVMDGERYFEKLRLRLLPDILVEASTRQVELVENILIIANEDGTQPSKKTKIKSCDLDFIHGMLTGSQEYNAVWLEVVASFDRAVAGKNPLFRFKSGNRMIWIRMGEEFWSELNLQPYESYRLRFRFDDQLVFTDEQSLKMRGYSSSSILSSDKMLEFCRNEGKLLLGTRHSDLHCNNIRWGLGRAKVIDLGSRDTDLLAVSEARLEVSIWDNVSRSFNFDDEEIWTILKNLQANHEPDPELLSSQGYILSQLLLAIRRGAEREYTTRPTSKQIVLAYVVQALLYQRYQVEQNKKTTRALDIVFTHWMSKLNPSYDIIEDVQEPQQNPDDEDTLRWHIDSAKPTLLELWRESLRSQDQGFLDTRAETFLFTLASTQNSVRGFSLTDFQQRVLEAAQDPQKPLFQSNNHVILAAPTSSGKSTVAEMFLLRPYLLNNKRRCALYIAPTRALTQAKYRDLMERFSGDKNLSNNILLSTGENTEDDWRINHGHFAIACMVYEKANILFSQNHKLLAQLGCVVVDEFHMLSDLDRGPILEIALTKIIFERRRIDESASRAPSQETIRIVAISTEGEPDDSIQTFLESLDYNTLVASREQKPIVVMSNERPVSVQHSVVLPRIDQSEPYHVHSIGNFTPTQRRLLEPNQLKELNKSLYYKFEKSQRLVNRSTGVRQEMEKRVMQLVTGILAQYPRGHQILVFVPSRAQIEDTLSGALRNTLMRTWTDDGSLQKRKEQFQRDLVKRVEPLLEKAEDKRMAKLVRTSAELGILIHHSDIEKRVRNEIEQISSTITDTAYSRVILATETLSYGVNLALHDVILLGTEFFTQTRFRETRQEQLTQCAYHNMVGRAGRLGKPGSEQANVYIVVPQDQNAFWIVRDYYSKFDRADSQVFVSDDKSKQKELEERALWFRGLEHVQPNDSVDPTCDKHRLLEAKDLSYPFVRCILDGLRHLNAVEGRGRQSDRAAITITDLLSFFSKTLYVEQFVRKNHNETTLFRCAVLRVLESCANKPLELVSHEGGSTRTYSITARGEAIIDTGTEIQTVDPLLSMVEDVRDLWNAHFGETPFPVELLILCVIAQHEVLRGFIRYTPESKLKYRWPQTQAIQNQQHVLGQFAETLGYIIPRELTEIQNFALRLYELVNDSIVLLGYGAAYENGATDSVVRFFNGIIAWINGEDRTKVYELIEGDNLPDRNRGKMERLSQFTEMLNYKIIFLAKILAPRRLADMWLNPEKERELRLLALRTRLGCAIEAIPLFWPWSSNFSRQEAVTLIRSGITPAKVLLSPDLPKSNVANVPDLTKLISDLEKYAQKDLDELRAEMTVGQQGQAELHRESISRLWEGIAFDFKRGVSLFRTDDKPQFSFDASLRNAFAFETLELNDKNNFELTIRKPQFDEHYRIRVGVKPSESGMIWYGDKSVGTNREDDNFGIEEKRWVNETIVNVIGVQFLVDWTCTVGGDSWSSFSDILRMHKKKRHLVIIPLPWLPLEDIMPTQVRDALQSRMEIDEYSTTIVTPAAFATMATFIMRDFVSSEDCLTALIQRPSSGSLFNRVTTEIMLHLTEKMAERQVPAVIREKIVELFEI